MAMISSLGGGGGGPSLPRDVKDAVSNCRASVQKALERRISRMDVEFPVGTKFGVEKSSSGKSKKGDLKAEGEEGVTKEVLEKSDRELARIFVEMFQPLGGDSIVTVFNEEKVAEQARKMWKSQGADCRVMSMGRRGGDKRGAKKKKKAAGFAAKMNAEFSPPGESGPFILPNCELALFVAPGPKELITIEKICGEVGMGTLVILLNCRLGKMEKFTSDKARTLFMDEFEPVFHLAAAPQEVAPNCLMYRAFPDEWLLARKPKVGQPKVIASSSTRMTSEKCKEAYDNMEIGDMEEAVEGVLGNVANWFK